MITRHANPFSYYCALAGIGYSIQVESDGLLLTFGGFNDKITLLMERILPMLTSTGFMELTDFELSLETVGDQLRNTPFDLTYKYLSSRSHCLLPFSVVYLFHWLYIPSTSWFSKLTHNASRMARQYMVEVTTVPYWTLDEQINAVDLITLGASFAFLQSNSKVSYFILLFLVWMAK